MFKILDKYILGPKMHYVLMEAPLIAKKAKAGQFVIVRVREQGERVPLTIADFDAEKGTITLVFQEAGKTTAMLAAMKKGDHLLDLLGPQGNPTEIEVYGNVVVIGGGIGVAPVYPLARALKEKGNKVTSIIGYRSQDHIFWEDKMRDVSDELIIVTDDGSLGRKAVVTVPLDERLTEDKDIALVYAIGPAIMMKFVCVTTQKHNVKTIVSLNSIMVDATGMCGACRVEVGGETKFACVDGPEFEGHKVDFNLLMSRQRMYIDEEKIAFERPQNIFRNIYPV